MNIDKLKQPRALILFFIGIVPIFILYVFMNKIVQDEAFHNFVDKSHICGISNFHNVITNLAFSFVSILGIYDYFKSRTSYTISWLFFFVGVFLVAPGSAYYHYNPNSMTLVWDRIPMTIGFMSLTSAAFCEIFDIKREGLVVILLNIFGVSSVLFWKYTGDLRPYYWVQMTPILTLSFMAFAYKSNGLKQMNLLFAVVFYVLAMAFERLDYQIMDMISYSGHSIKHILAALAVLSLVLMNYGYGNKLSKTHNEV